MDQGGVYRWDSGSEKSGGGGASQPIVGTERLALDHLSKPGEQVKILFERWATVVIPHGEHAGRVRWAGRLGNKHQGG